MDKHPYGEKKLDWYAPPKGATGLVIRQWYIRDEQHGMPDWFRELIGVQKKQRYFIFRCISGSHDYTSRNGESTCGAYTAMMGYWHYETESERDEKFKELIDA
jgi:hypothetical protein